MLNRVSFPKSFWIPVLALNLIPGLAGGAEAQQAPAQARIIARDLNVGDLGSIFRNFRVIKEGNDPESRVALSGMIFTECLDKGLEISNTGTNSSLKQGNVVGFRFTDRGGVQACVEQKKNKSCAEEACTSLRTLPGASMDLSGFGDIEVKLGRHDSDDDVNPFKFESLPKTVTHKTRATIKAERDKAAEEKLNRQVEQLRKQVTHCRKDVDQISVARLANDMLLSLNKIDERRHERNESELLTAQFNVMGREFDKLKVNDPRFEEMIEELKAFAEENPKLAPQVKQLFWNAAARAVGPKNASPAAFDFAQRMIDEAKGLSNLQDADLEQLQNDERNIKLGRMKATLDSGNYDPNSFSQEYMTFMQELYTTQSMCQTGQGPVSDSCRSVAVTRQKAEQLPQVAQQVQRQRYEMYMRSQQLAAQFGGGQGQMPGVGPASGGSSPFLRW